MRKLKIAAWSNKETAKEQRMLVFSLPLPNKPDGEGQGNLGGQGFLRQMQQDSKHHQKQGQEMSGATSHICRLDGS